MKDSIRVPVFLLLLLVAAAPGPSEKGTGGAAPASPVGTADSTSRTPRPWPLDIPIHLSSSFGEYRDGHLHAGVDIRSFGREGIPCRAVGAGYVSRLRASPFGYGRAIYVKLESGETAVYAHLSEFSLALDSVVCDAQEKIGRYQVDLQFEPGRLPVRGGVIIGYTGRTGTAAPHLHFEVRDREENPVNPLDAGWVLDDRLPPTIQRIEWLPLSPDARVDGHCVPRLVDLRAVDSHTFAARETLAVRGRLGVAAQMTDRLDSSSGRLAPYAVELEVDGELICRVEMTRFSYEHALEVELAYDMTRARAKGQHFLYLFRREGETMWNRRFTRDGVIVTDSLESRAPGRLRVHEAVVRAFDKSGRVSAAAIPFVVADAPASAAAPSGGRGRLADGRGELPGCYFFGGMVSVRPPAALAPASSGGSAPPQKSSGTPAPDDEIVLAFGDVEKNRTTLEVPGRRGAVDVHVIAARKNRFTKQEFSDIGATLSIAPGSLYSDGLVYLAGWDGDLAGSIPAGSGIRALTPAVKLGPVSAAFSKPIEIQFACGGRLDERQAVFQYDARSGAWSLRPTSIRADSASAAVREPGVYAVLADTLAPTIGVPQVRSRRSYATGKFVREMAVSIVDRGCGLDADRTTIYLDGEKQIARWDGFSEKLIVLLRGENIIGVRDLAIIAVDRLGNSSELVTKLHVSPPGSKSGAGGAR